MNMNFNSNKDLEEDEELASLRLAALLSRKSRVPALKEDKVETEKYSNPINTIVKSTNQNAHFSTKAVPYTKKNNVHSSMQNNSYSWRKPRWNSNQPHKTSQRSNLIVISPIDSEEQNTSAKVEKPLLSLPQDKWFPKVQESANEDSSSPSTFRKTGPTRFNRHDSDSDSSDPEMDDDDNDSCSRTADLAENYAEHCTSVFSKADDQVIVRFSPGANDTDEECVTTDVVSDDNKSTITTEKAVNDDTDSNLAVSSSKDIKLTNGFFSDDSSDSMSDSQPSSVNITIGNSLQENASSSPIRHFESVTMEDKAPSPMPSDSSITESKSTINKLHLSSESDPVVTMNDRESPPMFKTETSDHSPERHDIVLKSNASNVTTSIESIPDTSNLEVKSQPLHPEDLRLALKKRREERILDEKLKECDKDTGLTRCRSPSPSRSDSSSGSSSDSSSSTDFVVKSVSSIVKTVQSDKGQEANDSLHEHGSDNRRKRHRTHTKSKRHGSSVGSPESENCSRKWNSTDMQRKYSSGIKVQLSDAKRSYDVAPEALNNKRVPVHLRLGNPLRKRVIQMTGSTCFSDSDETNDVNSKCKKPNLQIVTEINESKSVESTELQTQWKKASGGHSRSLKEKHWKKSAR